MKVDSLRDLYIDELRDLLDAERQLTKALPKMAEAASASDLKKAFKDHLAQTEGHVKRLEQVFQSLGKTARGKKCKAMEGLVAESQDLLEEDIEAEVLDAALIAAGQRVEHYEMAGYGTVRTYAQILGLQDQAKLLQQTLDEEGLADKKLTSLAESHINLEAISAEGRQNSGKRQ